jgi:hypothetical protein
MLETRQNARHYQRQASKLDWRSLAPPSNCESLGHGDQFVRSWNLPPYIMWHRNFDLDARQRRLWEVQAAAITADASPSIRGLGAGLRRSGRVSSCWPLYPGFFCFLATLLGSQHLIIKNLSRNDGLSSVSGPQLDWIRRKRDQKHFWGLCCLLTHSIGYGTRSRNQAMISGLQPRYFLTWILTV